MNFDYTSCLLLFFMELNLTYWNDDVFHIKPLNCYFTIVAMWLLHVLNYSYALIDDPHVFDEMSKKFWTTIPFIISKP